MLDKLLDIAVGDLPRCVMSLALCRNAPAVAVTSTTSLAATSASPSQEDEHILTGNVSSDDDDDDPASAVANMSVPFFSFAAIPASVVSLWMCMHS